MKLLTICLLGLMASGCSGQAAQVARDVGLPMLREVAKAAAPTLRALAERKGIEVNEGMSVCLPISEPLETKFDVDIPGVAVMCWAPEL